MHSKGKFDRSIFGGETIITSPVQLGKLPLPSDRTDILNKSVDIDR
jgi:hypothetical protein